MEPKSKTLAKKTDLKVNRRTEKCLNLPKKEKNQTLQNMYKLTVFFMREKTGQGL